jgi:hypothetical protein
MTKFIASLVLAASILVGVGAAQANDHPVGAGLRDAAKLGLITPGGFADGQ